MATSSLPQTPITPRSGSKLEIAKETAKSLMKHDANFGPLCNMLCGFADMILHKKSSSEEEFNGLLDDLVISLAVKALLKFVSHSCIGVSFR